MTVMGIVPDVERVAVSWLASLASPVDLVGGVATTLPQTDAQGLWSGKPVFLLVSGSGGLANPTYGLRANMVRVDALAARGKWRHVSSVAELVQEATYTAEGTGSVTPTARSLPVNLRDVSVFQVPRVIRGDPEALARATMVLTVTYTIIPVGG